MSRTYKYRLRLPGNLLRQGRLLSNTALEQRITACKKTGKSVTYPQQWTHFQELRRTNPDTLGQRNATSVQQLLRRLDKANHHLALSAHNAGLAEFQQRLAYQAEHAGTQVVAVNPAHSSQMCSGCGAIVEKTLSARVRRCPDCGLTLDRDVNAAVNMLNLAVEPARTGPSGAHVGRWAERSEAPH